jgi:putative flippase GtrA
MINKLWKNSHSFIKFGVIGGIGFLIELAIFNSWIFVTQGGPLIANGVATLVAIMFNWWANSNHNFEKTSKHKAREITEFFLASLSGLLISSLLLWFTYYTLQWTDLLLVNAVKVVGLVLGAATKYILYKIWVFKPSS